MFKKTLLASAATFVLTTTSLMAQNSIDIVFVGKNTGNPYFDSLTQGFVEACEKNCLQL